MEQRASVSLFERVGADGVPVRDLIPAPRHADAHRNRAGPHHDDGCAVRGSCVPHVGRAGLEPATKGL